MAENQIEKLMKNLGISRAEALEVLEADKAIDKGVKLFELTEEQKQASKTARQADRTPTVYNFQKRERKADNDKRELMQTIFDALDAENKELINPEREMTFSYGGKKYKIVLSCPRS